MTNYIIGVLIGTLIGSFLGLFLFDKFWDDID
jgi:gas vesicle protein